jgi:hypothetical protein
MSIDEFYIRLMNEQIDGTISDGAAKKLAAHLMSDPEAEKYYEELKETVRAIDGAEELEPPPELRTRILDSVYGRSRKEPEVQAAGGRTFWRSFAPVFAAGVAAGFILFAAIRPLTDRTPEENGYGATIGATGSEQDSVKTFDAFGVKGSVLPVFESGSLTITIDLASDVEASVFLEFEGGVSFESIRSNEGAAYQMEVDEKSLLLVHHGEAEYAIRFRSVETAAVVLRIFTDGKTVAAMSFAVGG